MSTTQMDIPTEEIARRAYALWESRGCPPGDGTVDWEAALAELAVQRRHRNGAVHGLRSWIERVRQKVAGRDM